MNCPCCSKEAQLLSTTNEWKHYCSACDVRFNDQKVIMPTLTYDQVMRGAR